MTVSAAAWASHRSVMTGPLPFCKLLLLPPKGLQVSMSPRTWLRTRWVLNTCIFVDILLRMLTKHTSSLLYCATSLLYCSSPGTSLRFWKQFVFTTTIATAKFRWRTCRVLSIRSAFASAISNLKSTDPNIFDPTLIVPSHLSYLRIILDLFYSCLKCGRNFAEKLLATFYTRVYS